MAAGRIKGLPKEVAENFKLGVIAEAGEINTRTYGTVNLKTVSIEMAEKLAADKGFIYLLPKKKSSR